MPLLFFTVLSLQFISFVLSLTHFFKSFLSCHIIDFPFSSSPLLSYLFSPWFFRSFPFLHVLFLSISCILSSRFFTFPHHPLSFLFSSPFLPLSFLNLTSCPLLFPPFSFIHIVLSLHFSPAIFSSFH